MKFKLSIIFILALTVLLSFTPSVFAFKAEPVARPVAFSRDAFTTDLFTGSANYSHTIPVPQGTDNLTPTVELDYNSHAAHNLTQYSGIGWQVNRDYIERDINYTANTNVDDIYRLHFQGSSYELVDMGSSVYKTKIESNLYIKVFSNSGQNDSTTYWHVITKDGTVYRFGYASNSELMCDGYSFVHNWNIDQVQDVHGNKIFYTYTESNGLAYLQKIEYNTEKARVVEFSYDTNPYQRLVRNQGCKEKEVSRLTKIVTKANGSIVRQFSLAYTTAGNYQQLLQSITEAGTATASALPATTFEYKSETKNWASSSATWINNASIEAHLDTNNVALADVNGDGLTDIVRSIPNDPQNGWDTWKVLINQGGTSWSTTYVTWISAAIDAYLAKNDTAFVDVTGDSRPDIIRTEQSGGNVTWKVWRNTGSSWDSSTETWVNNANIDANLTQAGTKLADVNGDGLVDIVKSYFDTGSNHDVYKVFKNTGSSWSTSSETWLDSYIDGILSSSSMRIFDANGDGLADLIRTGTSTDWRVYRNTGTGWDTSYEMWLNNSSLNAYLQLPEVAVSDVNGDGLPDIVKSTDGGGADTWKVLLNKGDSWSTSWETWIDPSWNVDADVQTNNVLLADVNGDGLTDIVKNTYSGVNDTYYVWKNNGVSQRLLSKVTTSQGGSISFSYMRSTSVLNTGNYDVVPDLPFNLWIVESMTKNNGLTNSQQTNDVTTYTYGDGLNDYQDREFRGFEDVYTVEPDGSKKHYIFNQDDAKKGWLASVTTDAANDDPYAKTELTWSNSLSSGVYTVNLTTEKQYTYDGSGSSPKTIETDYDYDTYGNVTKRSEKGDTSINTDDRFIYFEYVVNTTDWIVNTPKKTYRNASNDSTKVSETLFYYDGHASLTDTPTDGDLTKEEKWLSGGTNPVTTYTYDSYGNQTSVTDDNSHTTSYSFGTTDTTYTYPDSMTNAKSQITTFIYDLGTGNLLSKSDPNSLTTTYTYDTFGRVTKEIQPYDSSTYPTVSYTYSFDGTAPESTLISKLEVSSASATLDAYTYTDGFGRAVQSRREAEDTSKQIVVDTFYDPNGQTKKVTIPYLDTLGSAYASPSGSAKFTQTAYDALSRPTTTTNPDNTTRTTGYDHWVLTNTNERGKVTK